MRFATAPAIEHDFVTGLPGSVALRFHRSGEIDSRDHREPAHDGCFARYRETILVVHGGIFDADGHVAVHQICFVKIGQRGFGTAISLFDHNRFKRGHATELHIVGWAYSSKDVRARGKPLTSRVRPVPLRVGPPAFPRWAG